MWSKRAFAGAGACLLAACAGSEASAPDVGPPAESIRGRTAYLTLLIDEQGAVSGAAEASAQFIAYTGLKRESALLALDLEAPELANRPGTRPPDGCTLAEESPFVDLGTGEFSLRLLDAGTVRLRLGAREERMTARPLPAVLPSVKGIVYAWEGHEPGRPPTMDALPVAALTSGGRDVGAFEVSTMLPGMPRIHRVNGTEVSQVASVDREGAGIQLEWAADGEWAGEVVALELRSAENGVAVRCTVRDRRALSIAPALARLLPPGTARLSVVRLRQQPFVAPGLDDGIFVLRLRHSVSIALR